MIVKFIGCLSGHPFLNIIKTMDIKWKTKEGKKLSPFKMDDNHCKNVIDMIRRNCKSDQKFLYILLYGIESIEKAKIENSREPHKIDKDAFWPTSNGEMAQMTIDTGMNNLLWLELCNIYDEDDMWYYSEWC